MKRMGRSLERWREERGQAMVEFALILPILLLLIVGIVEFGRAWHIMQVMTDAAREGARKAAIFDETIDSTDVVNVITGELGRSGVDPAKTDIDVVDWNAAPGQPVTVTLGYDYRFTFFGPIIGWTTGQSTIPLTTSFQMRNE